ncbi:MAG: arsenosugar biosynthesis radical SAM protein ArsS [Nitrospirota bacterium]
MDAPGFIREKTLRAAGLDILQVNLGYRCNMACKHCHVEASPQRAELMGPGTAAEVLGVLDACGIPTVDLTGGAPELNPSFRDLVEAARRRGRHVIVRSNLSIFYEGGMEDLPELYARLGVEVVASLPYYLEEGVDRVRGSGVFQKSIDALRRLNALGYGQGGGLVLNLVYNPQGAFLPPAQCRLEEDYRRALREGFGIVFDRLYTFTNMPIGRFRQFLERTGQLTAYMEKLAQAFNPATLEGLMCRRLVSVGPDGALYDCDFNQVLGLGLPEGLPRHVREFDPAGLSSRPIAVGEHCLACTAGQGST